MASPDTKLAQQQNPTSGQIPALTISSWDSPFDENVLRRLTELLPQFLLARRWYRAKARAISKLEIRDIVPVIGTSSFILVLEIAYAEGGPDTYLLPLAVSKTPREADEPVARLHGPSGDGPPDQDGLLFGAFADRRFRDALLSSIACDTTLDGQSGQLIGSRTAAFTGECGDAAPRIESFVSRAEQSNTSVIFEDRYILKLFRKIEPGINPDVEAGRFLTEHGFLSTPAVYGVIEYRSKAAAEPYAAAILQRFVKNQGDAWKYTLESLQGFFQRALSWQGQPPVLAGYHPLRLMQEALPSAVPELLGGYVESANLLGARTAQMHAVLTDPNGGSDFAPESFTAVDGQKLHADMVQQADIAFALLRSRTTQLPRGATADAQTLLRRESEVRDRFSSLRDYPVTAVRIRHHGDYHLGQVLYTGQDFLIIDFEGEPARPLSERRVKTLAMRDVAGMIRSFQYAAYAALFGQVPGVPAAPELADNIESWAAYWSAWASAIYLNAYFAQADTLPFIPSAFQERLVLFDAFLLQKALYEVAYELNNRPDWVRIPLRGILSLLS